MFRFIVFTILLGAWLPISSVSDHSVDVNANVHARGGQLALPNIPRITTQILLEGALKQLSQKADLVGDWLMNAEEILFQIVPGPIPRTIADANYKLLHTVSDRPINFLKTSYEVLLRGLTGGNYQNLNDAYTPESHGQNVNLQIPSHPVYPKAGPHDAPYSITEADLRKAIYIPATFTYGVKPPVLLIPGAGLTAGQVFAPNYGQLFKDKPYADPVYLNVPKFSLGDIQINAEYVAYAMNYIGGVSASRNIATISWSSGSLAQQWAFKYWPSTRDVVFHAIQLSGYLDGSERAGQICPESETIGCAPAIAQQAYNSKFIQALHNGGGHLAKVTTTAVWSFLDEVVQPQSADNASAFIESDHDGVRNIELQNVCSEGAPGSVQTSTHESILYNALAYAIVEDVLANGGPLDMDRIDLKRVCPAPAAFGLTLRDVMATQGMIPLALGNLLHYFPRSTGEPPIMPYARNDDPE